MLNQSHTQKTGLVLGNIWKPKDEPKVGVLGLDEVEVGVDVDRSRRGGDSDEEFEHALLGADEADLVDLAGMAVLVLY